MKHYLLPLALVSFDHIICLNGIGYRVRKGMGGKGVVAGVVFAVVTIGIPQMQVWEVGRNGGKTMHGPETRRTKQGTQKKCARARCRRAPHACFAPLCITHHFEGATASRETLLIQSIFIPVSVNFMTARSPSQHHAYSALPAHRVGATSDCLRGKKPLSHLLCPSSQSMLIKHLSIYCSCEEGA